MLAEIFMLKAEAAARVPSISRERTGQPFWRNLISAIADGRQRKADEYAEKVPPNSAGFGISASVGKEGR